MVPASSSAREPADVTAAVPADDLALTVAGIAKSFTGSAVLSGVSLEVAGGELLALLGPSGCGKTTLLRLIAGLERPDAGSVAVGGRTLVADATFVTPDKRGIGLVFQDGALFPHLDVGSNVAYGLNKLPKPERRARVTEALELVGLAGLEERSPSTLSGGQQQRVALARALAPRPQVLLLDEPFSNLDAALRTQLRTELHALLLDLGVTTVFVTHDQEEAFVLGDRVAVLRDGEIVQVGEPADVYLRPVDRWVARFVGAANLLSGLVAESGVVTALGTVPVVPAGRPSATADAGVGAEVEVLVRPEWIELDHEGAGAIGTVELVEYRGADTAYDVRLESRDHRDQSREIVTVRVLRGGTPQFARGDRVAARYAGPPSVAYPAPSAPSGFTPPQIA